MLHRQALACKKLSEDLSNTLATVVKVVNFIKAHPTNKRLYDDEELQTLLLHTEVRWLSHGQVFVCFMKLSEKIKEFLQDHSCALRRAVQRRSKRFCVRTGVQSWENVKNGSGLTGT